jgi:riboflavin kinase / FMN adenylyltransferase
MAVFVLLHFPDPSSTARLNRTVGVTHHRVLWSPDFPLPGSPGRFTEANRSAFRAATVRPAWGSTFIIPCSLRTIHSYLVSQQQTFVAAFPRMRGIQQHPHSCECGYVYGLTLETMTTVRFDWKEMPPADCRGGAVTFGNFDGVHRGHARLLDQLIGRSRALKIPSVAVTFDPHPLQLLRPEQFQPVLTTVADRAELTHSLGVDHVLILQTTPELLQLSAQGFFDEVVRSRLEARVLVEGVNFGFGRQRAGNVETLRQLCEGAGLEMVVVPPFTAADGTVVSSSRVRTALVQGDVRKGADFLGRPYRLRGIVGHGQGRGRTIGFPTANLEKIETLIPGEGVYAVRAVLGETSWPAAANIGPNPTFGETTRKVEVHLIGFQGNLREESLAVDFVERLRETRRFAGVDALVEQLRKDVDAAEKIVGDPANASRQETVSDLTSRLIQFLTEEVAPVLQMDGGSIQLLEIQNGVARVRIQGGCGGCPSSVMAIIMGLEQEMRRRIPQVEYLEVVP